MLVDLRKVGGGGVVQAPAKEEIYTPMVITPRRPVELTKIESAREGEATVIKVMASGVIGDYNSFVLDDPSRLVVDLWGAKSAIVEKEIEVGGAHIRKVRIGEYPEKVRLVFEPPDRTLPPYNIEKAGDTLLIIAGAKKAQLIPSPPSPSVRAEDYVKVTGVDFKQGKEGGRVVITTLEKADYKVAKSKDGKTIVLELKNSIIPDELRRTLDTSELNTPVASISSFQSSVEPTKDVRVLIKLKEIAPYQMTQEGKGIYIDFPVVAKAAPEVKVAEAKPVEKALEKETQVALKDTPVSKEVTTVKESPKGSTNAQGEVKNQAAGERTEKQKEAVPGYKGRKISLDFKDADIGNVLRLIAEVSQLNIIAAEDVTGKITIRLVDVPWEQAFDIILKTKGLGKVQEGNVVRVAPLARIKQEEESAVAAKRAKEKLEDLEVRYLQVNYTTAKSLETQVKGLLSDRGSVATEDRTNILIVKDTIANLEKMQDLLKRLDRPTPQVLIEARIVEAESSFARDLGVQWGAAHRSTGRDEFTSAFGSVGATPPATMTPTGFIGSGGQFSSQPNFAVNLPASGIAGALGALGFSFGKLTGDPFLLDIRLSAGEKKGLTRTISRPRIATIDNKEAKISQGDSVPFETTSASGTQTQFIDATLELNVTPHITPDGSITMKIKASRNSIGSFRSAAGTPSISKKEASTEIIVKDGETAVIGGIVISDKSDTGGGIPFLKDIPVLGWVFKNKSVSDTQKELLIFITPTIL
ncbi:MAG: type IV pilus secretin PilQ [Deltaproteobacteria bacterium]|nr:type IV pilus secretin PilQ [Deltaproteobacteria bacterium]